MPERLPSEDFIRALTDHPHFSKLGADAHVGPLSPILVPPDAIRAFVATGGGFVIIKFTKQALEVVDQVVEVIRRAVNGNLVPLRLVCPDGKTQLETSVREKEVDQEIRKLLHLCPKK